MADNVGIGRLEQVAVIFARQVCKTTGEPFRTRIFTPGTEVKMDFSYKHSRVKRYLKEGRALRIETVINKPPRHRGSGPVSSTCPSWPPRLERSTDVCS